MGFTEPQCNAAIRSCGGSGVSSVDDLVAWILENGDQIDEEEEVVVKKERKEVRKGGGGGKR